MNNKTIYAFPLGIEDKSQDVRGMTLRDWFAGMALQGELANSDRAYAENDNGDVEYLGKRCYAFADAMLTEREKGENDNG